jgi:putative FmdB family regulatory protein
MAIYDLACEDCGHEYEKFVPGIIRDEQKRCPECDSDKVIQKYNSFSIGCSSSGGGSGGCTPPSTGGFG